MDQKVEQTKEFGKLVELIGTIVEYRNPENHAHIKRVKALTYLMAKRMSEIHPEYNITEEKIGMMVSACSLHDIGKTAIPDSIILKPGRLTNEEYEYMKSHTLRGIEMIDEIGKVWSDEYDTIVRNMIKCHHEKYDGAGYPEGLRGDEIPIEAQILSLTDAYDALVNDRVYKKAYPKDVAFDKINAGDCGVFSPILLECFQSCRASLEDYEEGRLEIEI